MGYLHEQGFFLPPLNFGSDKIDAVILGLRMVGERGDEELSEAAETALAKIAAVLPPAQTDALETSALLAGPHGKARHLRQIRQAIRAEEKLLLRYTDRRGAGSERVVWPVAVGFFLGSEVLAAWCEQRSGFRHLRLDRIEALRPVVERMPRRHRLLLATKRSA